MSLERGKEMAGRRSGSCPYGYSWCNGSSCDRCRFGGDDSWEKYDSSTDRDTGLDQTNFYSGTVGETNQKRKVHVAINELGDVIYVRDEDGAVLYDKKNGIGYLPHDLNWSRY